MKYTFLLLGSIASLGAASAANAETIENALSKCSEKTNSLQRLVCYDRVVKDIDQYSGLEGSVTRRPSTPTASTSQSDANAETTQQQPQKQVKQGTRFGLEHLEPDEIEADTMNAVISNISATPRDKYILTLGNGSVWQQVDNQRMKFEPGQQVTIDRGLFGAFYLSYEGVNKRMKVKRVE